MVFVEKKIISIPFEYPLKGGVAVYTGHDNRILTWDSECRKKDDYKEMTLKEYIDYLEAEIYSLSCRKKETLFV